MAILSTGLAVPLPQALVPKIVREARTNLETEAVAQLHRVVFNRVPGAGNGTAVSLWLSLDDQERPLGTLPLIPGEEMRPGFKAVFEIGGLESPPKIYFRDSWSGVKLLVGQALPGLDGLVIQTALLQAVIGIEYTTRASAEVSVARPAEILLIAQLPNGSSAVLARSFCEGSCTLKASLDGAAGGLRIEALERIGPLLVRADGSAYIDPRDNLILITASLAAFSALLFVSSAGVLGKRGRGRRKRGPARGSGRSPGDPRGADAPGAGARRTRLQGQRASRKKA